MQKYIYENGDGVTHEFVYSDETRGSLTIGDDGGVVYAYGGKKTKFTLADCQNYIEEKDVLGNSVIFTESDVDIVMLAIMVGEQRLMRNNNHAETGNHEEYDDNIADPMNLENEFLRKADRETLLQAVSKLKPTEQYIIRRLYLDNVTVSQAALAEEFNVSENTVKQKAKHIRKKLQKILNK